MSETPRTDAANTYIRTRRDFTITDHQVWQEHGEHLERELSVANERIKRLEEMYEGEIGENEQFLGSNLQGLLTRELNWSKDRIKRLEEELNELRSDESRLLNSNGELERRIKRILEAGDKMFPWSERVGQEFWTKAKEAKL